MAFPCTTKCNDDQKYGLPDLAGFRSGVSAGIDMALAALSAASPFPLFAMGHAGNAGYPAPAPPSSSNKARLSVNALFL